MPLPQARDQSRLPDFEVVVRFLGADEGGRKTPAHQGYRPDMAFADEPHTWMISPRFIRDDGSSFPTGEPIPHLVRANMFVVSAEVRPLLRPVVTVARKVRMVEGSHAVAVGEVTSIENLSNDLAEYEGAASAFALPATAYMRWFWATSVRLCRRRYSHHRCCNDPTTFSRLAVLCR
jgi:hypothetical protein